MFQETNKIQEIVRKRLLGEPVTAIAEELGVSRQYIYSILSKMPKGDGSSVIKSDLDISEKYAVIITYLERYPPANIVRAMGYSAAVQSTVNVVAQELMMDPQAVYAVLYHMTILHPPVAHYPLYSNIDRWKTQNTVSFRALASGVKTSIPELTNVLNGLKHMSFALATRIKNYSGLSYFEIYSDLLELDAERQKGEQCEKFE